MTHRTKQIGKLSLVTILPLVFGAGAGWATTNAKVGSLQDQIVEIRTDQKEIKERVGEIFCATVPPEKRLGCR